MGYYTDYHVKIEDANTLTAFIETFKNNPIKIPEDACPGQYFYAGWEKWYDHDAEILEFSLKHPDHVIELTGAGEEQPTDNWRKFYRNGKKQVQMCKYIEPRDFDPKRGFK